MESHLGVIRDTMQENKCTNVIYTGDIFHKWNSSPELINFAIKNLPPGWAIPGNHDLPEHNLTEIDRSAYGTLVAAGVLKPLHHITSVEGETWITENLVAYGFPEGIDYGATWKLNTTKKTPIYLAVVHDYCWLDGHSFPGCPEEKHAKVHASGLYRLGFTAGVFGDNHQGFLYTGKPPVLNVGGLIRRNSDEKTRKLQLGLVYSDGTLGTWEYLADDRWEESIIDLPEKDAHDLEDLMDTLNSLKSETIDFGDAIRQRLKHKPVSNAVRRLLLRSIG